MRSIVFCVNFCVVALFASGCNQASSRNPGATEALTPAPAATTIAASDIPTPPAPAPAAEVRLDTNAVNNLQGPPQQVNAFLVSKKRPPVKTTADENLPSWVPVRGRLTVVGASDHAQNLGIDTGAQAPAANAVAATPDSSPRSPWLKANGRVTFAHRMR